MFRVSRVQTATRTCILEKIDPQRIKFTPSSDWGDEEIENNMICFLIFFPVDFTTS